MRKVKGDSSEVDAGDSEDNMWLANALAELFQETTTTTTSKIAISDNSSHNQIGNTLNFYNVVNAPVPEDKAITQEIQKKIKKYIQNHGEQFLSTDKNKKNTANETTSEPPHSGVFDYVFQTDPESSVYVRLIQGVTITIFLLTVFNVFFFVKILLVYSLIGNDL